VKLSGHKTSIKLEEPFWQAIGEIAQARGCSIPALIRSVAAKRVDGNLSSIVRVFVLEQYRAAGQKETKA
jgi:predicted DNA-binding ribbon-helix-helix protein